MNRIDKAIVFLEASFNQSDNLNARLDMKRYRLEHSYRVANIGKEIALKEQFDVEAFTIACLLHDLSYIEHFNSDDEWLNHGRRAAQLARPFIETLNFNKKTKNDILYGIAIHVDNIADFEGEDNAFALSVSNADNIDRYDVYRFFEMLLYNKYYTLSYEEQVNFIDKQIDRYYKLLNVKLATPTGTELFRKKIKLSYESLLRLQSQLSNSKTIK